MDGDETMKDSISQKSKPTAMQPLGIAELSPSITSNEPLGDSIAADILSSNAPIRTSMMDTAINKALSNKALRTSQKISLNSPRNSSTPRSDAPAVNSSVVLGGELEGSVAAASIVSNNPGNSHCIIIVDFHWACVMHSLFRCFIFPFFFAFPV